MTPRRRTLWWVAGTLGAAVLGVAACELAGWPFLRQPLQDAMTRAAGVPVRLEDGFRLSLIGAPGVRVGHLHVAAGGGLTLPHLVDARDVELGWRWGDVRRWRGGDPLRIDRLHARQVDARLVRDAQGHASWQLGRREPAQTPQGDPLDAMPQFGSLRVAQGFIVVDDQPLDTQLKVEMRGGEGQAPRAAQPAASQPGADAPAARSGYEALVSGHWRALPLDLKITSGSTLPLLQDGDAGGPAAPDVPLRVEGQAGAAGIVFDGQAAALLGARRLQGDLRFRGPSLARVGEPLGLTLPQTPPFDLSGRIAHDAGVWQLRADKATIGRSQLNGEFRYDGNARPGRLVGRLGGQRLLLADLAPAVGADDKRRPAAKAQAGKVLPRRRFDLPSLKGMNADVQVAVDELDFGSDAVSSLQQLRMQVLLAGGVQQLRDSQAQVAGGRFSGNTRLDAGADPARWGADVRFAGVDIAGWLKGLRPGPDRAAPKKPGALKRQRQAARQGGDQPVRSYLTGVFSAHVQATGQGRSTAEILGTLDGQAQATLRDGTISHLVTELAGIDLAQALGVLVRQDRPLPLRCARVDLVLQDGVARPRLAVLDNADSTVRVGGEVDLRNERLALRAVTQPKDFSPLSLRTPVTIGGTLGAPQVGVEGKRLAGKVLGALALGAVVGPAAALLPLMDPGEKPQGDPCDDKPPPPAKRP